MNNFGMCLLVLAVFSTSAQAIELIGKAVGRAYDVKTGELVYIEEHIRTSKTDHKVIYSEPTGEVFATKYIDYTPSDIVPDFKQINQRTGEEVYVKTEGHILNVKYIEKTNAKEKSKQLDMAGKDVVADAGFDQLVRERWDEIVVGKAQTVDFLVPGRLMMIAFTLNKIDCPEDVTEGLCLSIATDSWWLRLLVDPIFLVYDTDNRYLLRFKGRANISDKNGDYQTVDIHYEYQPK